MFFCSKGLSVRRDRVLVGAVAVIGAVALFLAAVGLWPGPPLPPHVLGPHVHETHHEDTAAATTACVQSHHNALRGSRG